jgi:hypothetical protein
MPAAAQMAALISIIIVVVIVIRAVVPGPDGADGAIVEIDVDIAVAVGDAEIITFGDGFIAHCEGGNGKRHCCDRRRKDGLPNHALVSDQLQRATVAAGSGRVLEMSRGYCCDGHHKAGHSR